MILTGLDSGDVSYPSVTCAADSGIHIVWYDASSGNQDVYYLRGVLQGATVSESRPSFLALRPSPGATIVRSGLDAPQSAFCNLKSAMVLCDASGHRVMSLRPGRNDVRSLPAGLYFVAREFATAEPRSVIIVK